MFYELWLVTLPLMCCALACQSADATPTGWKSHPLGAGQVTIAAPADYEASEEPDETLVLTPPNNPGIVLRFNLHFLEGDELPADVGAQFVRAQAEKKGREVTDERGRVILSETGTGEQDGEKTQMHFWQIGYQNTVTVMSATVVDSQQDAAVVKECLEKTVPAMIRTIKKR